MAGGRSQTVTDTQIASPMPGDIRSMEHWKLSKMRTPEHSPVIFQAKPCALTGRKKRRARSIEAPSIRDCLNAPKASYHDYFLGRRRDVRQQSRLFFRWNQSLRRSPNFNRPCSNCQWWSPSTSRGGILPFLASTK